MKKRAFTLIELLTVIAIIGVLMALLFPAIGGAMDNAKKAQAKNDLMQVRTGVTGFYTEYSRYPNLGGSAGDTGITNEADNAKLFNILRYAKDSSEATEQNPRGIVYLDLKQAREGADKPKGAIDSKGCFFDPWGEPYKFAIDTNYDNIIGDSEGGVTLPYTDIPSGGLTTTVVGWSFGKDKEVGKKGDGKTKGADDVTTW